MEGRCRDRTWSTVKIVPVVVVVPFTVVMAKCTWNQIVDATIAAQILCMDSPKKKGRWPMGHQPGSPLDSFLFLSPRITRSRSISGRSSRVRECWSVFGRAKGRNEALPAGVDSPASWVPHGRPLRPEELEMIRQQIEEGFDNIAEVDPEICGIVARNWPYLLCKLPPEQASTTTSLPAISSRLV
jgi:hypothetical protein